MPSFARSRTASRDDAHSKAKDIQQSNKKGSLSVNYHPVSFAGIIIMRLALLCHSRIACWRFLDVSPISHHPPISTSLLYLQTYFLRKTSPIVSRGRRRRLQNGSTNTHKLMRGTLENVRWHETVCFIIISSAPHIFFLFTFFHFISAAFTRM